jgi:hypothetical protein
LFIPSQLLHTLAWAQKKSGVQRSLNIQVCEFKEAGRMKRFWLGS